MNPIRGMCWTNLDDFKRYQWPESFVAVPRVGERVQGSVPDRPILRPTLKVAGVTHCCDEKGRPYISVELHR